MTIHQLLIRIQYLINQLKCQRKDQLRIIMILNSLPRSNCFNERFIQFITTLAVIQTYIREGIIILLKLVIFAMDQKNIKTNNLNYQLDQQDQGWSPSLIHPCAGLRVWACLESSRYIFCTEKETSRHYFLSKIRVGRHLGSFCRT